MKDATHLVDKMFHWKHDSPCFTGYFNHIWILIPIENIISNFIMINNIFIGLLEKMFTILFRFKTQT